MFNLPAATLPKNKINIHFMNFPRHYECCPFITTRIIVFKEGDCCRYLASGLILVKL